MSLSETHNVPVLVIGYGNALRGDDAAGRVAAERLARRLDAAAARVLSCHQLTAELAADVAAVDLVIFVDASAAGPPGNVVWREIDPPRRPPRPDIGHRLDPVDVLSLAGRLFGARPRACLITIAGAKWCRPDRLSRPVRLALGRVVHGVAALATGYVPAAARST